MDISAKPVMKSCSLKALHPRVASFYILTPIPGTEQYEEFHASGLISETNLDRFDATCPTWVHPHLTHQQLENMLYQCYIQYYGFLLKKGGLSEEDLRLAVFKRYTASQRMHPMSGGVDRVRADTAADYASLRRAAYDIDLAPLPGSLPLSRHDEALNRRADWRKKVVQVQTQPT